MHRGAPPGNRALVRCRADRAGMMLQNFTSRTNRLPRSQIAAVLLIDLSNVDIR
jgi:hypothetical protein